MWRGPETEPSALGLLPKDVVLLYEVRDDVGLMTVHEAGDGQEEHLQWVRDGLHDRILPCSKRLQSRANSHGPVSGQDGVCRGWTGFSDTTRTTLSEPPTPR